MDHAKRHFLRLLGLGAMLAMTGIGRAMAAAITKLKLSDAQWRERLSPERYNILRKEGTERAHSSPLNHEKRTGTFHCAGCDLALFDSETKYDSGTGWPSFYRPIAGHVETKTDYKLIFPRTEYHCARCGGHQGHIFKDGPPPTGLRYCNNGLALNFIAAKT
ncbi:MAG: peptide-methionine (R)-S-oxide reductase MsrB [Methyloligellaceae bacterium]